MPPAVAAIGAVATVVGTVGSISAGKKRAKAEERAERARRKAENLKERRSRRAAIREAIILRSRTEASGVGAGALGSGLAGASGSIGSQLGSNLGFQNQLSGINDQISSYNREAARQAGRASLFKGIADLGAFAFQASGGASAFSGAASGGAA